MKTTDVWADPIPEPRDPCAGRICSVNSSTGICSVCFRTMKEVREWTGLSREEQLGILAECESRKKSIADGKPFFDQPNPDRRKKK